MLVEHGLDFSDGPCWVQVLRASLRTVHDGVTLEDTELVVELLESLSSRLVTAVDDPTVRLLNDGRAKIQNVKNLE